MLTKPPNQTRRRLTATLLGVGATYIKAQYFPALAAGDDFPLFDALLHRGKPDLSRQGLVPMYAVAGVWRPGSAKEYVDEQGVVAALDRLPREVRVLYLDIENWPLLGVAEGIRERSIQNYLMTAKIIRQTKPNIKFGFYGIAPTCVYWPIVRHDQTDLTDWRAVNQALRPVADLVDFVLPSLYTMYDDSAGWREFASVTLIEARRYGKPVYPFLWFEYFDGNAILRGHEVNIADWTAELTLCRERADGIVFWGGSGRGWSESAAWWQAVLRIRGEVSRTPSGLAGS
jgi:hypothetical protein